MLYNGLLALVVGCVLGIGGRRMLRSRVRLTWSEAILCGLIGAIVGAGVAGVLFGVTDQFMPVPYLIGAVLGTLVSLLVFDWVLSRRGWLTLPAVEILAEGESARVEFKSTARFNLHSKTRDDRIEAVIAKTVAAFANAEGGCLLIGVSDDGRVIGLADDYSLMKSPDRDRYELWMRDLLTGALGVVATKSVGIDFATIDAQDVCVVRVPPATRPVFLVLSKDKRKAFYVRVGNSTRELDLDEAVAYCAQRWDSRTIRAARR
ncbi:MAG: ATP-binding protein [Actinomycetes bacterium]